MTQIKARERLKDKAKFETNVVGKQRGRGYMYISIALRSPRAHGTGRVEGSDQRAARSWAREVLR